MKTHSTALPLKQDASALAEVSPESSSASVLITVLQSDPSKPVLVMIVDSESIGREVVEACSTVGQMDAVLNWCENSLPACATQQPPLFIAYAADRRLYVVSLKRTTGTGEAVNWQLVKAVGCKNGSIQALQAVLPPLFAPTVPLLDDLIRPVQNDFV